MATTIFQDSFAEASDTDLHLHAPNTGTSWTMVWQTASTCKATVIAATGRARTNATVANSGVIYSADATYGTADYEVSTVISAGFSGSNKLYLIVRMQDQENMYALRVGTGASNTRMYKKVSGIWSAIGSFLADPAVGDTVKLRVSGTTLTYYYNGTLIDTQTASDHASAGKAGIAMGGGAELAASTDDLLNTSAIDSFQVNDLVFGPTAPTSLTATEDTGDVDLAWTDNSSDETDFVIERSRGGSPHFYQIATVAAGVTTYTDTAVDPGYTYYYRVKARNGSGDSAYATSSGVTLSGTKAWTGKIHGFLPLGEADGQTEIADGRVLHGIIPEFATIETYDNQHTGMGYLAGDFVLEDNETTFGVNAYTPTNVAAIAAVCERPQFMISAVQAGMAAMFADSTKRQDCIDGIVQIADDTGFDPVLDFEGYGDWTSGDWTNYCSFAEDLATALHAISRKLSVCGPPISTDLEQTYYVWNYSYFESSLVDYLIPMLYDWQYDHGGGTSVQQMARAVNAIYRLRSVISDTERIMTAMPSYGYYAAPDGGGWWTFTILTKAEVLAAATGFGAFTRNADGEMVATDGTNYLVYQDTTGLNTKREVLEDEGALHVGVWHLGDNDWPNGKSEIPADIPSTPDPNTTNFFVFF
jgi:hypothetical protein